mmetsp:Transcript_821/g.2405  ORF Transcript_821/g.2405 Transcript_821/m.2405 type:complete len:229 (-) Transcript_821:228-914(-)
MSCRSYPGIRFITVELRLYTPSAEVEAGPACFGSNTALSAAAMLVPPCDVVISLAYLITLTTFSVEPATERSHIGNAVSPKPTRFSRQSSGIRRNIKRTACRMRSKPSPFIEPDWSTKSTNSHATVSCVSGPAAAAAASTASMSLAAFCFSASLRSSRRFCSARSRCICFCTAARFCSWCRIFSSLSSWACFSRDASWATSRRFSSAVLSASTCSRPHSPGVCFCSLN